MKKIEFAIKHLQTCYLNHKLNFAHNNERPEEEQELLLRGYHKAILDLKELLNETE